MLQFATPNQPHPTPMLRANTRSSLSETGELLVNSLALVAPRHSEPAYYKTTDNFLAVNVGLLKYELASFRQLLRARISFYGGDIQERIQARVDREFTNAAKTVEEKRNYWIGILSIAKRARTERVSEILNELREWGIEVRQDTIRVHRVSNSFYLTLDANTLRKIVKARKMGFGPLRHIRIDPR